MATNINFNKILGISKNSISIKKSSIDPNALAFIIAAGITNPTQQSAINTLVTGLKTDGLWTKMKAIYPFVGGTATSHKFNLKDPRDLDAAFRLVFSGGWTHSSTGALPNGTNAYANTFLTPSVNQTLNSNGLGAYINFNTGGGADPVMVGAFNSVDQAATLVVSSTNISSRLNAVSSAALGAGSSGQYDTQKTSATITNLYRNGTSLTSFNSGGTLPTVTYYIGTMNFNNSVYSIGWTANQFRFTYFSDGLTAGNITNLRTRIQAFQTTLSRQI